MKRFGLSACQISQPKRHVIRMMIAHEETTNIKVRAVSSGHIKLRHTQVVGTRLDNLEYVTEELVMQCCSN